MQKVRLVLEAERQKSLCLGEETKEQRALGSLGEHDSVRDLELMGSVCREDPPEQIRGRQGVCSVFSPLCYSAGLWSSPI